MKYFVLILSFLIFLSSASARQNIDAKRFEHLSGIRKSSDPKVYWDKKYAQDSYIFGKIPAKFLSANYHFIPGGAKVLDVGMGEGRNAVFLARKGYTVVGVDISAVAVRKAKKLADEFGVRINTVVAPMQKFNPGKESYDAIICFYYVDRALNKRLMEWLKPGGILIYESHSELQKTIPGNESYDEAYLLKPGELLTMFKGYKVLKFEEPTHQGEYTASIIVEKPRK